MVKYYAILFSLALGTGACAQHAGAVSLRTHMSGNAAHAALQPSSQRGASYWSDDFSDPSHWTFGTLNGTAHNWAIGTTAPSGDYAIAAINSTSAANGFALFDSDLMCGPDNGYMVNSTPVDLSAVQHVQLQFEQFYRRFEGRTFLDVSNDNVTWTTIELNSYLTTGAFTQNATLTKVDISAMAAMQPTVWFRFRYEGNCDYAWMVDDVALVEQPAHEMLLVTAATTTWDFDNAYSYDSVYYSMFPAQELRPLAVNMTLFNAGYEPATNVMAHITTSDGYDQSGNVGTLAPGDTLTWFGPLWMPGTAMGEHTVQFRVTADTADADTMDNAASMAIQVNGNILARDLGSHQLAVGDGDQPYMVGNWMHVRTPETLLAIDVALASTSEVGVEVNARLLDSNRQLLAESIYHTVTAADLNETGGGNFISLTFDAPVQLEAGGDYFVALQHFGGVEMWVGASGYSVPQTSMLYRVSNGTWYSISPTPMVRMHLNSPDGITELEPGTAQLSGPWPNPADASTQITCNLERSMKVDVNLYDINGRLVRTVASGIMSAGPHQLDVDTQDLPGGVYNCTLRTAGGMAAQRVVVMH